MNEVTVAVQTGALGIAEAPPSNSKAKIVRVSSPLSFLLGESHRNIIMWLDHRAVSQVHRINETKHRVLQCVGGVMSVEMQAPKLLWLKEVSVCGRESVLITARDSVYCGSVCTRSRAKVCSV